MAVLFMYIACSGLFVWSPCWTSLSENYESSLGTFTSHQKTAGEKIHVRNSIDTVTEFLSSQGHATALTSTVSEGDGAKVMHGTSTAAGDRAGHFELRSSGDRAKVMHGTSTAAGDRAGHFELRSSGDRARYFELRSSGDRARYFGLRSSGDRTGYFDLRSSDKKTSSGLHGASDIFARKTDGSEIDAMTRHSEKTHLSDDVQIFEPSPFRTARKTRMISWRDAPVCNRVDDRSSNEGQKRFPEKSVSSDRDEGSSKHHFAGVGENYQDLSISPEFYSNTESEDGSSVDVMPLPGETDDVMYNSMTSTTSPAASSRDVPCDVYVCDCSLQKKRQALCCGRQYKLPHIPSVPAYIIFFHLCNAALGRLTREKLGNLSNFDIQRMDLQNNRITFLANDTFADFKHLKRLDLGNNPISAELLKNAFYSIRSPKFHTLRLDSMFLYNLPDDFLDAFKNRSMDVISISNNSLETFNARVFSPLRSLRNLYLSDNCISNFGLSNTVYVQKLNLDRNVLTAPPLLCNTAGDAVFPNLFSLYLAGNPFKTMSAGPLRGRCLPKLHKLDISSASVLKRLGNNFIADLPRLENLMAGHMNALSRYDPYCFNSSSLTTLYLVDNRRWIRESIVPKEIFAHAPSLKSIDMTKIKFGLSVDVDLPSMLLPAQSLVSLSMGSCTLGRLPADTLWRMPNLRKLDLIANRVYPYSLGPALRNVTHLHTLILQANKITAINESTFPLEFRQSIRVLDLSKNDFACTCDLLWFKSWIELEGRSRNVTFRDFPSRFRCRTPDKFRYLPISSYNPSYRECHPLNIYVVAGSVAGVVVLATAVTLAVTYRYRWYLRYYIYRLRRRKNDDLLNNHDDDDEMLYDVYIAYSQFDVDWVVHDLAPLLEASPYVESVFIKDRDQGGGALADNIVKYMDQSARIVLVLSDGYTREGWSGYEFNNVIYAANEQHKDVIVILKGDVEAGRLTKDMRRLLTAGTFLHWGGAEEARGTFRDALRVALNTRGNFQELV